MIAPTLQDITGRMVFYAPKSELSFSFSLRDPDDYAEIGAALRTRTYIHPVYVSRK